ncbi:MAG TPA: hypothetical protein VFE98_00890 [Candidatus Bathyarchaeia archaeon]|nr:hypothetical protein [Candidatus Bathyarchaeia archaeon]
MTERPKIKVTIEWGDIKHVAEGELETVVREVIQFAAKVLPNYTLASKLTFSPDYSSMVDDLSQTVKLTPDGEVVLINTEMSAENSILTVLLASRVANAVGTRPRVDMDAEAISKAIGKAVKTVRNTLAMISKTGVVERNTEGSYKLTIQGIRKAHEVAKGLTAKAASSLPEQVTTSG